MSYTKESIWKFAEQVREVLKLPTHKISYSMLEKAVKDINGRIEVGNCKYEAIIQKVEEGEIKFKITLQDGFPNTRKKFTIAHELGHLFIHMGYVIKPEIWNNIKTYAEDYKRKGYNQEEFEANEFAAALLMPEQEYKDFVRNTKDVSVSEIASHFDVSKDAALYRGRALRLISY